MFRSILLLTCGFSISACASAPTAMTQRPTETITVTGSIAYRERIALPPTAEVHVELRDVSRMDAPSPILAEQSFSADGKQVPFAFSLTVERGQLDPRHSYAVAARITGDDGKLMFITDTHNRAAIGDGSDVAMGTLMLVKVD